MTGANRGGAVPAAALAASVRRVPSEDREGVVANLLLIDDDPGLMSEQVRQAFPAPRHRVGVARTGAAGLGHFRNDPPDVVLLDPRLPDQCGLSVHRQIRRLDARIPVIFVTGAFASAGVIRGGAVITAGVRRIWSEDRRA